MRYAIVSFDDTEETDFLPLTWMKDRAALLNVSSLVASKSIVSFYWPPWKNGQRVAKAKKECFEPEIAWPVYTCRILSTAENELEARQKCKQAEFSSTFDEIDDPLKRKRKQKQLTSSSSSEEEDIHITKRKSSASVTVNTSRLSKHTMKLPTPVHTTMKPSAPSPPHRIATVTTKTGQLSVSASSTRYENDDVADLPSTGVENIENILSWTADTVQQPLASPELSGLSSRQFGTTASEVRHDASAQSSRPPPLKTPVARTSGGDLNTRLMLKILASMEDIRQTQKLHSAMLQSISRQFNAGAVVAELPEGVKFPIETEDDLMIIEALDPSAIKVLVEVLADNGGSDLRDFVRRSMGFVFGAELSRKFNITGQRGKRAFKSLKLFDVLYGAVKQNNATKSTTRKMLEDELAVWLGNARDRGRGSRRLLRSPLAIHNEPTELEAVSIEPEELNND